MKKKLVLGLGSNLGNRYVNILQAIWMLEKKLGAACSLAPFYETPPWGDTNQAKYLNTAIAVDTSKTMAECLQIVQAVEQQMGRQRIRKWGPRNIDVDILLLGAEVVQSKELEVPHKELANRAFVLVPLHDILPDLKHPVHQKTIQSLLQNIENNTTLFAL